MSTTSDDTRESDFDSDAELQKLHAEGKLGKGLNALVPQEKKHVNNVARMKSKLEEFKLHLDWIEFLDLSNDLAPMTYEMQKEFGELEVSNKSKGANSADDDAQNDFKRELTFYRQAQGAVLECIPRLKKLGVPTKRPDDYFAEMAKSDEHMKRIREKLLHKQLVIERSEKARKLRELKKYGKQIQHEVLQKRQKEKKELLESVKKYKKGQKESFESFMQDTSKKSQQSKNKRSKIKQQKKNEKYGYGGKKKRSKYNDANSAGDISGFKSKKVTPSGKKFKQMRPSKNIRKRLKNRKRR
ncbi:probable rRNA-processing protein EBP2 [Centruroides sculpturatus]|uniref:probable rRNA-processing protein EBP2 n=1 Tax=Centruroides sculpturatus TaxID=218467 RepID=UPI000C6E52FB|nr:probable rRNA-processing protein EBP2 [Centruroides sculpturatus]